MKKTEIKKLIEEGFNNMDVFDNLDWSHYREKMFVFETKCEKDHRSNRWDEGGKKDSVSLIAKYFCVKWFGNALEDNSIRPRNVLWTKQSSLIACGLVDAWPEKAQKAFDGFDWTAFNTLEYSFGSIIVKEEAPVKNCYIEEVAS